MTLFRKEMDWGGILFSFILIQLVGESLECIDLDFLDQGWINDMILD